MNQHRDVPQSENSKRMTLGEQLTLGLVIDIVFGFILLAASAVAPALTIWSILAVVFVAAVWVWARVAYRVKSAEAQAKKGARGANGAV
jgi:uncharacterized membrane protein HdeD (DUF308 family)